MPAAPATTQPAEVSARQVIVDTINRYKPVMAKLLASSSTSEDTFIAQVANAFRAQPKLWACDIETVLGAVLRCAALDLPPNDSRNLAWIIPYGRVAQFQLGYGGVMELARRAVPGSQFDGAAVYPNDQFVHDRGSGQFSHVPWYARRPRKANRGGEADAWWVRFTLPDGRQWTHSIDRDQVEYHRGFSKQPDGDAWTKSYDSMALKSVVMDMRRFLPQTELPQLMSALAADSSVTDIRDIDPDAPELPPPAPPAEPSSSDDEADAEWVEQAMEGEQ